MAKASREQGSETQRSEPQRTETQRTGVGSLTEQVYEKIKREILTFTLKPGDEFTELDVAERLSVSKTPVREALMRLQFEALVKAYPRRGYRVEPIKVSDINDIFDMRALLEIGAVEMAAARASDAELEELEAIAREADDAYDADPAAALAANNRFHASIAKASGNPWLHRSLDQLLGALERFFYIEAQSYGAREIVYATHQDIASALRRRDLDAARAAVADHVEGTRKVLLAAVVHAKSRTPITLL